MKNTSKESNLQRPKKKRPSFKRIILNAVLFFSQIGLIICGVVFLCTLSLWAYVILHALSAAFGFFVLYTERVYAFKVLWMFLVLALPGLGLILYILWGYKRPKCVSKKMTPGSQLAIPEAPSCTKEIRRKNEADLSREYPDQEITARYLQSCGFPVYKAQDVKYYPLGDDLFPDLLESIRNAKKYVFIETFILSEGRLWKELYEILLKKAAEGVDVRILYDDFGCFFDIPYDFGKKHSVPNLQIAEFSRFTAFLPIMFVGNHRNHQKLVVIDGIDAYTGGVNIADEYANYVDAYGMWKDTGVRIRGEGAWSLTVMFLQMWAFAHSKKQPEEDYLKFYADTDQGIKDAARDCSYAVPLSDGPYGSEPNRPIEYLYLRMINRAEKYVYISTPYLIPDAEMITALSMAALSGVDVRIVTPGIPDKKYVFPVTQFYYGTLLRAGVKIYEYTPGFIHAKSIVADDETALVGTVNLDYRSFYLHFEDAVWCCGGTAVREVKDDFDGFIKESKQITLEEWEKRPLGVKIKQALLKFFAPLY